jgi:phosphoserine phosphatase
MGGDVKFEVALEARLQLIAPSRKSIDDCLAVHPPVLTPGVADLVAALKNDGKDVYLVSGGFRLVRASRAEYRVHSTSIQEFKNQNL